MQRRVLMGYLMGCLSLTLILCSSLRAGDWPRWRGPDNDGHAPESATPLQTLPDDPQILWQIPVGDGLASPVVSNGKVIYFDNQAGKETIHVLDSGTGQEAWKAAVDDVTRDSQSAPGPRCTPVIDGDRVYAQSCKGELQCFNIADGKLLWHLNYVKDFGATFIGERGTAIGASRHGYAGPPLVDGDRLIATAGGPGASLVCLNKLTGETIWKSGDDVAGYGSPVIATIGGTRQIIVFTAKAVAGFEAGDGKSLWRVPLETQFGRHAITPIVVDDIVVVSSHTLGLMGIRVTKEGDAFKADKVWTSKDAAINYASPVALGNYVYGIGPVKTLLCMDAKTGQPAYLKASFFGAAVRRDHAGFIVVRNNLLILTDGGQLMLVNADPKGPQILGQAQVCSDNWCNPAYAGGKLFLRDNKALLCVKLTP